MITNFLCQSTFVHSCEEHTILHSCLTIHVWYCFYSCVDILTFFLSSMYSLMFFLVQGSSIKCFFLIFFNILFLVRYETFWTIKPWLDRDVVSLRCRRWVSCLSVCIKLYASSTFAAPFLSSSFDWIHSVIIRHLICLSTRFF